MTRSRIFDEYVKIATEQGLVKNAEEYSTRETFKKKEPSDAEILYGILPDGEKPHIMEQAHPEPVIISPAYDNVNGLVENNIERQNIIINQVGRDNTGTLTNKKLATKDLVFELVRISNDLDNRGKEQLSSLADVCIEQLTSKSKISNADWLQSLRDGVSNYLGQSSADTVSDVGEIGSGATHGAIVGGLLGGVLGGVFGLGAGALPGAQVGALAGAAVGGLVTSLTKTGPTAISVSKNSDVLVSEIDDLLKKFNDNFLLTLKEGAEDLKKSAEKYSELLGDKNANAQRSEEITKDYLQKMNAMVALNKEFARNAATGKYTEEHNKLLNSVYWFMDSDEDDVKKALNTLMVVIEKAQKSIQDLKSEYHAASEKSAAEVKANPVEDKKEIAPKTTPVSTKENNSAYSEPLFSLDGNNESLFNLK